MTNMEQELYEALVDECGYDEEDARYIVDSGDYRDYEDEVHFAQEFFEQNMSTPYDVFIERFIDWEAFGEELVTSLGNIVVTDHWVFELY